MNTPHISPRREFEGSEGSAHSARQDVALDVGVRVAAQSAGAMAVAIALLENGRFVCRARLGDVAPDLGMVLDVDTGITGASVRTAQVLNCYDTQTDGRVDADVCRRLGIRSILVIPILVDGAVAGVLEALSVNPRAFGPPQIEYLNKVADFMRNLCCVRQVSAEPPAIQEFLAVSERTLASKHRGDNREQSSVGKGEAYTVNNGQASDPGLTTFQGALKKIPLTSSWEDICQELASRFEN